MYRMRAFHDISGPARQWTTRRGGNLLRLLLSRMPSRCGYLPANLNVPRVTPNALLDGHASAKLDIAESAGQIRSADPLGISHRRHARNVRPPVSFFQSS